MLLFGSFASFTISRDSRFTSIVLRYGQRVENCKGSKHVKKRRSEEEVV